MDANEKSNYRLDAADTVFFKRQLEFVKSKIYEEPLQPLKAFQLLPLSAEAPLGATQITWREWKGYGLAKFIADYATDFPRSDIGGVEHTVEIKDIGMSFAYTIREIRRAAYAGVDLPARKAVAARRAIEEKLDYVAWFGDADTGLQGFLNYPGISEYTVPATGTGSTKTWSTKTPDQILTDLFGLVNTVVEGTQGVEMPDTILMPLSRLNRIKQTRLGSVNDTTIYEFFLKNNPGVTIDWVRHLETSGTGGIAQFYAYKKDSEHLTHEVPVTLEVMEERMEGMEYVTPLMATTGGIICYRPASISFGEGI
jgi:hypothetical protein